MKEVRCPNCNKLACMATEQSTVSVKCGRCNTLFTFENESTKETCDV